MPTAEPAQGRSSPGQLRAARLECRRHPARRRPTGPRCPNRRAVRRPRRSRGARRRRGARAAPWSQIRTVRPQVEQEMPRRHGKTVAFSRLGLPLDEAATPAFLLVPTTSLAAMSAPDIAELDRELLRGYQRHLAWLRTESQSARRPPTISSRARRLVTLRSFRRFATARNGYPATWEPPSTCPSCSNGYPSRLQADDRDQLLEALPNDTPRCAVRAVGSPRVSAVTVDDGSGGV